MTRVELFVRAIARAEGFGVPNSVPTRTHNPADLRARSRSAYAGQIGINNHGYVIFKDDAAGWAAAIQQTQKMISGESFHYVGSMTIKDIAKKYATGYKLWSRNVSKNLGVPETCTLYEYFDIPPKVTYGS